MSRYVTMRKLCGWGRKGRKMEWLDYPAGTEVIDTGKALKSPPYARAVRGRRVFRFPNDAEWALADDEVEPVVALGVEDNQPGTTNAQ